MRATRCICWQITVQRPTIHHIAQCVARELTTRYSIGFSIAAGIWFASAFLPPPIRFVFWIIGLVVDINTPLIFARQLSIRFAPHMHHLPERFGSFTIIVLGISILGVVDGIAAHNWTAYSMLSAGLGLGIAFSLWWVWHLIQNISIVI